MTKRGRSAADVAPLVAGVLLALPTLVAYYPPMSDIGLHEGAVGILRHFGDETYFPSGLYTRNLGHPNQFFHVSAWLLSYGLGTRWAIKIVIALSQVLIFHAGARLSRYLGRSPWSALLLAPLALGFTYYWGLVANLIGYAAFLYALPTIDRALERPRAASALASCGMLLVLFFAHGSVFLHASAIVGAFALCHPLDRRKTTLRLLPVGFAGVIAIAHTLWERSLFTRGQVGSDIGYMALLTKIRNVPIVLYGSHETSAQVMLLALSLGALAALVVSRRREQREGPKLAEAAAPSSSETPPRFQRFRAWILRWRFEVVGVAFLLAYFTMPFNWRGATLIHERFLGPAWALLVLSAGPRGSPSRLAILMASVVPVSDLLVSWPQFFDSDRTARDLDAILEQIPKGSAVAPCVVDRPGIRVRMYSAGVSAARAVAVRGGRMGTTLTISPISPVQIRPDLRWDSYQARTFSHGSWALLPEHDLKQWGWVIAQSRDPFVRQILVDAFAPEATFVDMRGEWLLFRSNFPTTPIDVPENEQHERYESMLDRVVHIQEAQQLRSRSSAPRAPGAPPAHLGGIQSAPAEHE